MNQNTPIKVLLVEDEPMWQQGIRALLSAELDIALIGVVDNADDAEIFADADPPDIFLLDWKIRGDRDGLVLAKALEKNFSAEQMILVTGSPLEQIPENPYGLVPKSKIASNLVAQIRLRAQRCSEPV